MKLTLAIIASLFVVQGFSQILPNGGFEEWTTSWGPRPVDWATDITVNGSTACSGYHPYYEQSNDAFDGDFALYMDVEECLSKTAGFYPEIRHNPYK